MFRTPAKAGSDSINRTLTLTGPSNTAKPEHTAKTDKPSSGRADSAVSPPALSPTPSAAESSPVTRRLSFEMQVSPPRRERTAADDRVAEARSLLVKAKIFLKKGAKNTSKEVIKNVTEAVERLYQLVKESQAPTAPAGPQPATQDRETQTIIESKIETDTQTNIQTKRHDILVAKLDEQNKILNENQQKIEELSKQIQTRHTDIQTDRQTYSSVAAASPVPRPESSAMHSIIVGSQNKNDTGEEVFERMRKVLNAKEEGTRIDRIRRARDNRIIVGCRDKEDINRIREKISSKNKFTIHEMKNKDPLIKLYGVLRSNTDEDIVKSLKSQNKQLYKDCNIDEAHLEIYYRGRARNPLTTNVVVRVPPTVWQAATAAGVAHIDMQRVRVTDQSPLIQCSRCLGYGHGKKFCQDPVDVCGHCGGAHLRSGCPVWLADGPAHCTNCAKAKLEKTEHNAFSGECPVRRKWDALARSTVAYC